MVGQVLDSIIEQETYISASRIITRWKAVLSNWKEPSAFRDWFRPSNIEASGSSYSANMTNCFVSA